MSEGAADSTIDVAIVGAGAAGAVLAAKLGAAGLSVTVFEAGPDWQATDLVSSQIWSRRLRWGGPPVASTGPEPIGFGFNAGWGVGGAALHHYGTWPRLKPADFSMARDHARGRDWPIDYATLSAWYDLIQAEVGVAGDAVAEVWRPAGAPYPMPPLPPLRQGALLAAAFAKAGIRTAPAPMAINTKDYGGRPPCQYDGWCDAGCPIGALANPQAIYLPKAKAAGVRVIADAPVVQIVSERGDRVEGIEYLVGGRERRRQRARLVILAGSVVGNPALMLQSAGPAHPRGIGNAQDLVGRGVMTHGLVQVLGLFPDTTEPHLGVTGAHLISHDAYGKRATAAAFGSRQWLIAPSIKPNDLAGLAAARPDLNGAALDAFMQKAVRHAANMVGMCESEPDLENRVVLLSRQNTWGVRAPELVHRFSADAKALYAAMVEEGERIFRDGGATEVWHTPMGSAHLMGGTAMGRDAATSVTDDAGKVHGISNLYVAGPGLFPTGGAVNPTFTVHALAARTAQQLIENRAALFAAAASPGPADFKRSVAAD